MLIPSGSCFRNQFLLSLPIIYIQEVSWTLFKINDHWACRIIEYISIRIDFHCTFIYKYKPQPLPPQNRPTVHISGIYNFKSNVRCVFHSRQNNIQCQCVNWKIIYRSLLFNQQKQSTKRFLFCHTITPHRKDLWNTQQQKHHTPFCFGNKYLVYLVRTVWVP